MSNGIAHPSKPEIKGPSSNAIAPNTPPVINRYSTQGPTGPQDIKTPIESKDVEQAKNAIQASHLISVEDVEKLKSDLGISSYSHEARFKFYVEKIATNSQSALTNNVWGLAAYELNGMPQEDIIRLLSFLTLPLIKLIHVKGKSFPGVGAQSNCVKITGIIIDFEDGKIQPANSWTSFPQIVVVQWNRNKLLAAAQKIIPSDELRKVLFEGPNQMYGGFPSKDLKPVFSQNPEISELVWDELRLEGSNAAINIWDSAIFSWGRGFAGFEGGLLPVLQNVYKDPFFTKYFNAVGVHIDTELHILGPSQSIVSGGIKSKEIWEFIKHNRSLLLFFIALGEVTNLPLIIPLAAAQDEYRQKISNIQFNEIVKKNGIFAIKDAQFSAWKNDFAKPEDFKKFIKFIAHLFHWLPVFGVDIPGKPYKDSSYVLKEPDGSFIKGSIKTLLLKFAEKASADKNWRSFTEISILPPNEQKEIIINSLLNTKHGDFAPLIMDQFHFLGFGGSWNEKTKRNEGGPVREFLDSAATNASIIEFSKIELFENENPLRGYIITDMNNNSIRLNKLEFQQAALYFVLRASKEKNKPHEVIKGFVIKQN